MEATRCNKKLFLFVDYLKSMLVCPSAFNLNVKGVPTLYYYALHMMVNTSVLLVIQLWESVYITMIHIYFVFLHKHVQLFIYILYVLYILVLMMMFYSFRFA